MNKIFKVIWNHAAQRFDVVSELTKSNGKSSSTTDNRIEPSKALLAVSVAGAALLGSAQVMAATTVEVAVAGGTQVTSTGQVLYAATPIGTNKEYGDSVLIGKDSNITTTAGGSVIVGPNASGGAISVVIGSKAVSLGEQDVVIGPGADQLNPSADSYSTVIGRDAINTASGSVAVAIGYRANTSAAYAVAIGGNSTASGAGAAAIAYNSTASGGLSFAMGHSANASGTNSLSLGTLTCATMLGGTAIGTEAKALNQHTVAVGSKSEASGTNGAVAIGWSAGTTGDSGTAVGPAAKSNGERAVALGRSTHANGTYSTALGPTNKVNATAAYSTAVGALNNVTGAGTSVLGSNITATAANNVILGQNSSESSTTTTVGVANTVNTATVGAITYSGFQGVGTGIVSVGGQNAERQIINVAPGNISATSTDAINGSQLYMVAAEVAKGFNVTNAAGDTTGNILPGEQIQFTNGDLTTSSVTPQDNGNVAVTFNVDKGTFNAPDDGELVANPADTGVATVADVANAVNAGYWKVGNKDAVVNNVNFGDDVRFLNGTNTTVTVAADGADRTNITIDTDFSKLPTLNTATANINNNGGTISVDVNTGVGSVNGDTGVASVNNGDTNKVANISNVVELVNNTGWNVFQDSDASANKKDLVVAGDNVVFAAGTNTTVSVETDAAKKTTTIKYDVDLSKVTTTPVTPENTTLSVTNGAVDTPAEGGKLVNATTVADAINDSGWQTTLTDGTVETINPGDKVNYVNGTTTTANVVKDATGNVNVTFEVNKQDITATDGKAALEGTTTNADNFVTAGDVINTINNVYWTATSDTDGGKFATTGHTKSDAQVKAGDAVTFKAGEGLTIKQDGRNFTYAVAAGDVTSDTNVANVTTTLGKAAADTTSGTVATVGDVADAINNSGWVTTTTAGDTVVVNPGDTVSYVDGKNTKANVVTNTDGGVDVTFDVNTGTSSVATDGKAEADTTNGDVATITDVVNTINSVYHSVASTKVADTNGESTYVANDESKINAGDTVNYNAGQNIKIAGKGNTVEIATTENVTFTNAVVNSTLSLGNVSDAAAPVVNMTSQAAVPATNNDLVNNKAPTTALNITAKDGNPTQITGVGSVLNTTNVETNPDADTATNVVNSPLVNLGTAAAPLADNILNSAATVRDLANMGWVVSTETGEYKDTVKNANEVKFVAGSDRVSVTGKTVNDVRTITIDLAKVKAAEVTDPTAQPTDTDGDVNFADTNTTNVTVNPNTGVVTVDAKTTDLTPATDGSITTPTTDEGKKLVNATTVANAINKSGFTLKSSAAEGTKVSGDDEVINPGDVVDMVAGKNMTVKQEKDGKITYATAEDVDFNTVTLSNGTEPSVKLVNEAAVPASNNDVANAPTTALNITSTDGKPTQITGVGSVLNTTPVATNVNTGGTPTLGTSPLVNLGTDAAPLADNILNSAATVRDLANMGWVVSTKTGAYKDTVKNANEVQFIAGSERVSVTGETNATSGVREITIDLAKVKATEVTDPTAQPTDTNGDVNFADTDTTDVTVNPNTGVVTVDVKTGTSSVSDGTATDANGAPIAAGKAVADTTAGTIATIADVVNTINSVYHSVNSTKVAGTNGESTYSVNKDSQIGAGDVVNYNAGQNIKISGEGNTVNISTTENVTFTNAVVNKTFSLGDVANTSAPVVNMTAVNASTPVAGDVTAINIGGSTITNLAPNLPTTVSTGDEATSTKSQAAPTVTDAQKTNAATLGDVLNAGWNLKTADQGGLDFVKPYDTVNFVNGVGTSVVSSTDGNVSNIQYNVNVDNSTTKITYVDATGGALTAETQPDGSVIYKDAEGNVYNGPVTSQITAVQPQVNGENVTGPVNLVDGNTTTVTNTPDGIKVEVNTGNTTVGADGKAAPRVPADADKVATVGDLVETINNVGWFTNSTTATGGATDTKISAGKAVNFEAGKNMEVTQKVDANGNVTYTYATADDVTFNSTKVGGTYTDAQGNVVNNAPITIGTTPEGKNVISNLNSTLPTTVSTGDKATSTTKVDAPVIAAGDMTNAATLGDVLNAGWNLKTADQGDLDFVKPYDTVNFVNGVGTSVVSSTNGNVSNIQYNVNVDGTTTEITYVTKVNGKDVPVYQHVDGNYYTGENGTGTKVETPVTSRISAILPKTQVNGNNVTGPVNLVNGDTTTVTNTPDGIKVEVNTGNTTVGTDGKAAPLAPEDANKVVTVGDIVNTINNVSWNAIAGKVAGSNGEVTGNASTPVKAGDTVTYNAGNNIKIEQTGTTFNISTTDNVTFTNTNVTGNLTVEGNTTVNNFTVNPNSTINMGGNTITNIKDGEKPTDAATVQQLENVTKNITGTLSWKVTGNNNADNATTVGNQTVSFNNGTGTTAVVNGTNVTYNVNFGNLTSNANGTVSAVDNGDISPANQVASVEGVQNAINKSGWLTTNSDGSTSLINPGDTVNYVNGTNTVANVTTVDGTTTVSFDAKTTDLTVNDNGTIAAPAEGSSLVNASTLANTVNNVSWTVNASRVEGSTGVSEYTGSDKVKAGDTVTINAGNNVIVSGSGKTINIATSSAPTFTNVTATESVTIGTGDNATTITSNATGINIAGSDGSARQIHNVAPGTADTDAVNVSQLKQVAGDINNKINRNNKDLRAGIAGANAAAGLPQVYIPGKSMVAASAGTFKGQSAVAVGYSRASDNGKLILKLQGNANTRGDVGGSIGVGYQW